MESDSPLVSLILESRRAAAGPPFLRLTLLWYSSGEIASVFGTVYEPRSSFSSEHRMRFPAPTWTSWMAGPLAGLVALAGVSAGIAADRNFPYDSTLLLEAKAMKGSKRVPILQIESKGEASIDLWCNTVPVQLVVVDSTITIILGSPTQKQCDLDRMQADQDLMEALQQLASWRRQDDLLLLQADPRLRFPLTPT